MREEYIFVHSSATMHHLTVCHCWIEIYISITNNVLSVSIASHYNTNNTHIMVCINMSALPVVRWPLQFCGCLQSTYTL